MKKEAILKQLPVDQLKRGRYQPREVFDPVLLEELAQSIRSNGLIQPLVVRPIATCIKIRIKLLQRHPKTASLPQYTRLLFS